MYELGEEVYILVFDDEDTYRPLKGKLNSLPTSSTTPGMYTIRLNDDFKLRVYPSEVYKTVEAAIEDIPDQEKMLRQQRAQNLANQRRSLSSSRKNRKSHKNRKNRKSRRNSSRMVS